MFVIVLKVLGILILIELFLYAVSIIVALVAILVKSYIIPNMPTIARKTARAAKFVANLTVSATRKVFSVVKFVVRFGK